MEIYKDKALVINTNKPETILNSVEKSSLVKTYDNGVSKVLVNWGLEEVFLYVRDGQPLAKNYMRFKKMVDALIAIPGTKYPEYKMALTRKMEQCDFDDENRWVRGIADLVIVDGDQAYIIDYKTGSNRYPDPKQLRLMSLMAFVCFPEVNNIKAGLLFCMKNSFVQESYTRQDIHKSWKSFETPLDRLTMSYEKDEWIPNPTPLCGWCPVETCTHHKPRR